MEKSPFVGRKKELEELELLLHKKNASLVVIQGRRRIGKSRLVMEFGKKHKLYAFAGFPPSKGTTAQAQRDEFSRQLGEKFGLQGVKSDDWSTLFTLLAQQVRKGKTIILLDEISWMGSKDPNFLGKLKTAWDLQFKQNPELMLILCGSVSPWIEKNILSSTGFLGRISTTLYLKELSLLESSQFLTALGYKADSYEKLKILSITGGVPRYLEEIQPSLTAEENIRRMCFQKGGFLYREFDDIFSDLFSTRSAFYRKIVEFLIDGHKEFNEIVDALKFQKSGHVSEYLDNLIKSGFICRDYTWHLQTGKESRLSKYRICDNYIRFYLKYISKNKNKIESGYFENKSIVSLSGWDVLMGYQFENLVLNNRFLIWNKLRLIPEIIVADNPYFQRKTSKFTGCQIDYLIQTRYNNLFACEIKFSKKPLGVEVIHEMKAKMQQLAPPKGLSKLPILIHVNGVSDRIPEAEYFTEIIDFGDYLEK